MNVLRFSFLLLFTFLTASSFTARLDDPDAVVGRWLSSKKKNQVQIYKQGNRYFGKIVWMAEPNDPDTNRPKLDKRNPEYSLRSRPILHLPIMTNLTYQGGNVWGNGQIYNPEDGKTYGCELTLKDANSLDLRGFMMGMTFLGKTATWTRVP